MDDPVLSDFHTEDSNGTVYYTILEDSNSIQDCLNTENLLNDQVFYLSFENDEQTIEQNEESNFQDNVFEEIMLPDGTHAYLNEESMKTAQDEESEETEGNLQEVFEEIMLPDGTHAYLKNNIEIDSVEESTLLLQNFVDIKTEHLNENSADEDDPVPENAEIQVENLEGVSVSIEDTSGPSKEIQYEQVQLADGTYAMIDSEILRSLLEQSGKKSPSKPSKEVYKAYDCPHENCSKSYTTMHHLRVHMRNHTGNRPYQCEVPGCEKSFLTGYSLKAHSRTHTGEKPYACRTCQKSFKTSGDLLKHVRIHTGEKPFLCPIPGCGRSFTTSNIRKVHVRSHTGERPYECTAEGCDKAFASATNFKNHMRIHSGEKPYVCNEEGCGKRFTEYSSLYKHHLIHANIKPCKCEYCGKTFRQTSTLVSHKRSIHNIFIADNGTEIMLNLNSLSNVDQLVVNNEDAKKETQIVFVSE